MSTEVIVIIIILIILAFAFVYKSNNVENMASDGGALIQLNAKGPMDEYLIGNATDYYPYVYGVRPKRAYRTWPYWSGYYGYPSYRYPYY
jgi:hypothetical protein